MAGAVSGMLVLPLVITAALSQFAAAVADTFQILALASRAFALYYLLQCLVAIRLSNSLVQKAWMSLVSLALLFIVLFAVPAG